MVLLSVLRHADVRRLGLIMVLVQLAFPVMAQEWTYTARKGDNLWLLAEDFLVSMQHWREFRAMNNVPRPRQMAPGTVVRFPARWLRVTPAPVEVVAVSGSAIVRAADGSESPARVGATLGLGTSLTTGPGASVVLRFADGGRMLVRTRSEVRMDELGIYGKRRLQVGSRARLQRGRVEVEVPPGGGSRMEITTPSASAVVRGTRFRVSTESEVSRTEVEEGRVQVASQSSTVSVEAGRGTLVRPGKPPSVPIPLLDAAALGSVPPVIQRRQIRIRWPDVAGAAGYAVQIATGEGIPTLLVDVSTASASLELPDLPDARYLLRVRAVDAQGLEGLSAEQAFELNARPEPPATLEPRPDATVRVTRPRFGWSEPVGVMAYRLQVATDAAFARRVHDDGDLTATNLELPDALEPGDYFWRVATVDGSGEQGPYGDTQLFTVRPAPPAPGDAAAEVSENDVLLRWQAGQPGQTYEVEMAASEDFATDARTESVDEPQLSLPIPEADLWFRVRVVDTDGYRGPFGTPNRIEAPVQEPWWLLGLPFLILLL
jgi:hypothetical protein